MLEATKSAKAHWNSINLSSTFDGSSPNQTWKKPPYGWLKVNSDTTFHNGKAQASYIIQNVNGQLSRLAPNITHAWILSAEALAILDACKFIHLLKIKEAIFETDSLNAISFIKSSSGLSYWTTVPEIDEIKKHWHLWPKWRFKFIPINANGAANALAKYFELNPK